MEGKGYRVARGALLACCAGLAAASLVFAYQPAWAGAWSGWSDAALARLDVVPLTVGILGGSALGKWVASLWLVAGPLRRGERWAVGALGASHATWLFVQALGAGARTLWLSVAPAVVIGLLLLALWKGTRPGAPIVRSRARLALALVCLVSIGTGVGAAFAFETPIFELYRDGLVELYGPADAQRAWWSVSFGAIGAHIAGHFVALTAFAWFGRRPREVVAAAVTSMLAWFVVDTSVTVLEGAWFNLVLVAVPSLIAVIVPSTIFAREGVGEPDVS